MIPSQIFINKEHGYPTPHAFAAHFGLTPVPVPVNLPMPGAEAVALVPNPMNMNMIDIPNNTNLENILQVHRRKMLRRAANRKSAQLSRARKKAHLEELKIENIRLQRLVDILDSQPELVFVINGTGKITYISERTLNFIKISYNGMEDCDEDPTHVSQLLCEESVKELMDSIMKLRENCAISTSSNHSGMTSSLSGSNSSTTSSHSSGQPHAQPSVPIVSVSGSTMTSLPPQIDVDMNMLFFSKVSPSISLTHCQSYTNSLSVSLSLSPSLSLSVSLSVSLSLSL